jgi:hypothetical protein
MTQYVRPGTVTTSNADVLLITSPQPSSIIQQQLNISDTGGTGGSAVTSYVHTQSTAAAVWSVTHALGYYPQVMVQDVSFNQLEGDVRFTNANVLTITFSAAVSGVAYLS